MDRAMLTIIAVLVVLGLAAEAAIAFLVVTGGSEYLEFAIAMVLMVAILVGSYLYVITPQRGPRGQREERGNE